MTNHSKMIFLDLDGTLMDDRKQIPEYNIAAIHDALAAGHKVIISTGRPLCSAKKLFPELNMEQEGCYAIVFNGGLIYDIFNQKTLFQQTLPVEHVRYIFEKAKEHGIYVQTYSDDAVLCPRDMKEGRDYSKRLRIERVIVPDVFEELGSQDPCKVLAIADGYNHKQLEDFREIFKDWAPGKADIFFSCYEYLEFVPVGISKGSAVRFLADYLNIPIAHTIAVGDAENDIPMIKAAGLGVAMQNATNDIKEHADYITERDNNQGGVGEVIRKFIL